MVNGFVTVAKASEILEGHMKSVQAQGKQLLLCHVHGNGFYAIDDTCTHDDGPLADGWLEGTEIECPRHGARFNVTTGNVICLPAAVPINAYAVKVEGDDILVDTSRVHPKT